MLSEDTNAHTRTYKYKNLRLVEQRGTAISHYPVARHALPSRTSTMSPTCNNLAPIRCVCVHVSQNALHAPTRIHMHTYTFACVLACTYIYMNVHMSVHLCTHMYIHIHTYACICTYMHTYTLR